MFLVHGCEAMEFLHSNTYLGVMYGFIDEPYTSILQWIQYSTGQNKKKITIS